ncbi:MAG: hypothetical protein IK149_00110 [Oscillospiraceae bacterium]|nr:hypothetical protein [Oscillospiraceae bacterium]
MKHPALARMLGVFLAVISLLTIAAGGLAFVRSGKDYAERLRQNEVLEKKIARAEELRGELAELQPEYDAIMSDYAELTETHRSEASAYRMRLATYTATKAGISLGRSQLDDTSAMLDESMELFLTGFFMFKQGEDAFQPIYEVYLTLRGTLDAGLGIYDEAAARQPSEEDGEPVFSPEEVLALAQLGHESYAELSALLTQLREQTPSDQRQAAELIRTALETYSEVAPELENFSIERLSYSASLALYEQAEAAMEQQIAAGMSEEEARGYADLICEETFGLSFAELGELIAASEPEESGEGGGFSLSPEMTEMLLGELPGDQVLLDGALAMLAEADASLSEKEGAFRADPHDMSAAELLLGGAKEGLDASQRLLGAVEPTILETKRTLDSTHEQLDAAWYAIYSAQQQVEEAYQTLEEKLAELPEELNELQDARGELKIRQETLEKKTALVDGYEDLAARARSLRAELLGDDDIYVLTRGGAEYLDAAKETLALRQADAPQEYRMRQICCVLMAAAGLFGFVSSLGAFEKPRMKHLWLPLLAAVLPAAAAEALSVSMGRGLWYTGLFVIVFGLLVFPLTLGKRKGEI